MKKVFFLFVLWFFFVPQSVFSEEIDLTWMEANSEETIIYYSSKTGNTWTPKEVVAKGYKFMFTPAVASGNERIMVVWVESNGPRNHKIFFSEKISDSWSNPKEISTSFQEVSAPALIIYNHKFHLFFAANNGDNDDIYMSSYDNTYWSVPKRIHAGNSVPDILPQPEVSNGILSVMWQSYNGSNYITMEQELLTTSKTSANRLKRKNISKNKNPSPEDLPEEFQGIGRVQKYIKTNSKTSVKLSYATDQ